MDTVRDQEYAESHRKPCNFDTKRDDNRIAICLTDHFPSGNQAIPRSINGILQPRIGKVAKVTRKPSDFMGTMMIWGCVASLRKTNRFYAKRGGDRVSILRTAHFPSENQAIFILFKPLLLPGTRKIAKVI